MLRLGASTAFLVVLLIEHGTRVVSVQHRQSVSYQGLSPRPVLEVPTAVRYRTPEISEIRVCPPRAVSRGQGARQKRDLWLQGGVWGRVLLTETYLSTAVRVRLACLST